MTLLKNEVWDLSELFQSETDPNIDKTLSNSLEKAQSFQEKYKGQCKSLSPEALKTAFETLETLLTPLYKLSQYAGLKDSENTDNTTIKKLLSKIDDTESKVSTLTVFFHLELANFSKSHQETLKKATCLENYHYAIDHGCKTHQYNLSENEENIISLKDITGVNGYQNLYGDLCASFTFQFKQDGKTQTLNGTQLRNLRYHKDQKTRQKAMKTFFNKYKDNKLIFTHLFNNILKDYNDERQLRGYKNPISKRNISNDLPEVAIEQLHNVTTKSNHLVQRYYSIKKKLLGLKTMTLADIYAPLPNADETFTYKKAKDLVLESFYAFDQEFGDIASMMFNKNRIHAPVLPKKRGGAFCSGYTPDTDPYVMLNFLGKPRDVSTMAHELGHAIHDVLASTQSLFNYHPILPLAETASVFSEMITTDLVLKTVKNKETKRVLLCEKLEDIFATSHRQNMFSEFEKAAHQELSNTILTAEQYCDIYKKGLQNMFGTSVTITDEYHWEWATIPHFLDFPFYVHAYNFGNLLVFALYQQYQEEGQSFVPKLKNLLSAGSSKSPIELTKAVQADITKASFWQKSVTQIERLLDELETCL